MREVVARPSGQTENRGVEVEERRPEDRGVFNARYWSMAASRQARPSSTEPIAAIAARRQDPTAAHTGTRFGEVDHRLGMLAGGFGLT